MCVCRCVCVCLFVCVCVCVCVVLGTGLCVFYVVLSMDYNYVYNGYFVFCCIFHVGFCLVVVEGMSLYSVISPFCLFNFVLYVNMLIHYVLMLTEKCKRYFCIKTSMTHCIGVGLGRVVRKVRQHPDDHDFESQRWQ
jgi:hypothetical protein